MDSWKESKQKIWKLVKFLSAHYGGDDEQFLIEYCRELVSDNKDDLSRVVTALEDMKSYTGKDARHETNGGNSN